MPLEFLMLARFRDLFAGTRYLHRRSHLGDSVAYQVFEDLYGLGRSTKLVERVASGVRVLNPKNRSVGIKARRGDGTFGESVPESDSRIEHPFQVRRGLTANVEIGVEVKIVAKAMLKQIDRVMNDLRKQVEHFHRKGGNAITVGIVGINYAEHYTSYEKNRAWPTDGIEYKHPIQEAAKARERIVSKASDDFDELMILPFRATNSPPYPFEWVDEQATRNEYASILTRMSVAYDRRF